VTGDGQKVNGLRYKDRVSGEEKQVELEGIFVQIGLLPNTDWLKGSVELSKFGEMSSMPRAKPACRGCLLPAIAPPCPTSRSLSPWAPVQPPRCRPSII